MIGYVIIIMKCQNNKVHIEHQLNLPFRVHIESYKMYPIERISCNTISLLGAYRKLIQTLLIHL